MKNLLYRVFFINNINKIYLGRNFIPVRLNQLNIFYTVILLSIYFFFFFFIRI